MAEEAPAEEANSLIAGIPNVLDVQHLEANGDEYARFYVDYELNTDIRAELSSTIINNGWSLMEMRPVEMTLEDIFLRLTAEQ